MTIAIDTSALMAVVLGEENATHFARVIAADAGDVHVGAAILVEARIVADARHGPAGAGPRRGHHSGANPGRACRCVAGSDRGRRLAATRQGAPRRIAEQGDCYSYALARSLGTALLYKGDDFAHISSAI